MNHELVDKIARAVLYEGYILYPYRPSVKNHRRWTFGGLFPRSYSEAQNGSDACTGRTRCLIEGRPSTNVTVTMRFLHLIHRQVGRLLKPVTDGAMDHEPEYEPVDRLQIGARLYQSWQEAEEQSVRVTASSLGDVRGEARQARFTFPGRRDWEPIMDGDAMVGVIVRQVWTVEGDVELTAQEVADGLFQLTVSIENLTSLADASSKRRDEAALYSLASAHAVLEVHGGEFVSLLDPPDHARAAAAACRQEGLWPVLVGDEGDRCTMLAAPIILYDYPRIAPESPGDLFDGTEIDEILTLRIMTLTDEEKQAAGSVDNLARAMLDRTEALGAADINRLHGVMRRNS